MSITGIEWTDRTWNPTTGCTQVSPGCDHCYAKTLIDRRLSENPTSVRFGHPFEEVMMHEDRLVQPLLWRKPQRIFVNSMSDLFHERVSDEFIAHAWWIMGQCAGYLDPSRYRGHSFQILTKRPERMRRWVAKWNTDAVRKGWIESFGEGDDWMGGPLYWPRPLGNVWLGVSIESNAYAWRADMLRETPAAVRFLSIEPLLGPVDAVDFTGIDWIIVGGESGRGARPIEAEWIRDVRDRAAAAGIPFFFKQWGGETKKRGHEEAILDGVRHVAWPA